MNVWQRLWRRLAGGLQWRILWLLHDKFVVGVSGVIFNEQRQVLLIRHRFRAAGAEWGLPGGHAEGGETLAGTLAREVHEETGYRVRATSLLQLQSGFRLRLEVVWVGEFLGGTRRLDAREATDADFFAVDDLPEQLLPSHCALVGLALERRQRGESPV